MIYSQRVEFANTLYSKYPLKNAGGDEQLTLKCYSSSVGVQINRVLLAPPISPKYSDYESLSLCLYPSYADLETSQNFDIDVHKVDTTDDIMWSPGFGLESYHLSNYQGSSWKNKNSSICWKTLGGDYAKTPFASVQVSNRNVYDNLEFQIDNQINYGILLKFSQESNNRGYIRYYSPNTNTNFYPKYVYYINDYYWSDSSHSITDVQNYIVSIPKINLEYQQNQIERFYLRLTPQVYSRDWTTSYWSASSIEYCLTSSMVATYCLYDVTNIEKFKVFDHNAIYTRLSCDGQKNYFDIDMQQLPRNRFYQLQLKIDNKIYNIKDKFRVV